MAACTLAVVAVLRMVHVTEYDGRRCAAVPVEHRPS